MDRDRTVATLMEQYGRTYADEAGITLRDTPAPLYQLLVLTVLCSVRISAATAVAAARELFADGLRTPRAMTGSTWRARVDALGRAHYVRYDESTATALGRGAELLLDRWHGDLRRLRDEAGGSPDRVLVLLREFPRIGPVGAGIFCREAQEVWPGLRPFFDERVRRVAADLGLPHSAEGLAELVGAGERARLAAALTRVGLAHGEPGELLEASAAGAHR
ncbi:endonuclease [Kitasatospora sp. CM 4170]|uniref:Endonuclease n=1 Tax=Kitasatospora aburaviensis TaxID=67265 RepID=A0ABW1EW06_9ACTN|nr:endonuclease [Kitasatospora sp. CM 4170]WNM43958.1 endonuclease [Kitasatospora sp. CM 4170]